MRALRIISALLLFALAASAGTYTVRRGDTLGGIAKRHGVGLTALAAANGIGDVDHIVEGRVLSIPGSPAPAAAPVVALHRVSRGETLGAIARRVGITVSSLMSLNGIADPNRIREGQILKVGGGAPAAPAAPSWVCPVAAPVRFVSFFGDARGRGRRHQGVDLLAPRGTPVVANVSGTIDHHPNAMGGNAYYLHGDDGSVYYGAHLDEYIGAPGRVQLGQAIGRVGNSGNASATLPHLHFEQMPGGGAPVNPHRHLDRACFKR